MATDTETLKFQTEVKQLLHLMVHSLYSNREIFLRELISNASDAADKLRFEALSAPELYDDEPDLDIRIEFDTDAGTITIVDNGIGMSRDEVIQELGTIAKSGTAEFLSKLTGESKKDSQLIGQFGVGFYSSFIVSDRVDVHSRRAGQPADQGVLWSSDGNGEFSISMSEKDARGTRVTLHLKEDAKEFADGFRLRHLVRRYSDHIAFPVLMTKMTTEREEESDTEQYEAVNTATALWTRPRTEVSETEYEEFYNHISHDFEAPLAWSHNRVEGKREYTSLLYIPARAPFDLWNREAPRGLKLYVQRVFIMDEAEQFLPMYLRFVRGVVDSGDLSLNVSRELLQKDPTVDAIRGALTKRVLDMLGQLATKEPEKYRTFWCQFGQVLKEGPADDHANRDKIAKLLRFSTTAEDSDGKNQSLDNYVERMSDGQDKIYYVFAENLATAESSPHLEIFRKKGIEVLLLSDRIDDWLMNSLDQYEGKKFADVARGDLDLGGMDQDSEEKDKTEVHEKFKNLIERAKKSLGDKVADVRTTQRLTESPACLVVGEHELGSQMRRILEAAGQETPKSAPILELNPTHPLVERLGQEDSDNRFADLTAILFEQATLAEGGQLSDPGAYVRRMNNLLLELTQ